MNRLNVFISNDDILKSNINSDLFICEAEFMLYDDLSCVNDNIYSIKLIDTLYILNLLLSVPIKSLEYDVSYNRINLYRLLQFYFYSICDFELITVSNKQLELARSTIRRLNNAISNFEQTPNQQKE